jgi:hypothetical protein
VRLLHRAAEFIGAAVDPEGAWSPQAMTEGFGESVKPGQAEEAGDVLSA